MQSETFRKARFPPLRQLARRVLRIKSAVGRSHRLLRVSQRCGSRWRSGHQRHRLRVFVARFSGNASGVLLATARVRCLLNISGAGASIGFTSVSEVAALTDKSLMSHRHVIKNIKWAMAEAIREEHRQAVMKAESCTIMQDARLGKLLVRLYFCDAEYNIHQIVLGWHKDCGGTAEVGLGKERRMFEAERFCL